MLKTITSTPGMQRSRVDRNCSRAERRACTCSGVFPWDLAIVSLKCKTAAAKTTDTANPARSVTAKAREELGITESRFNRIMIQKSALRQRIAQFERTT